MERCKYPGLKPTVYYLRPHDVDDEDEVMLIEADSSCEAEAASGNVSPKVKRTWNRRLSFRRVAAITVTRQAHCFFPETYP